MTDKPNAAAAQADLVASASQEADGDNPVPAPTAAPVIVVEEAHIPILYYIDGNAVVNAHTLATIMDKLSHAWTEIERLRVASERIHPYLAHRPSCAFSDAPDCTCGLDDALAAQGEKERP